MCGTEGVSCILQYQLSVLHPIAWSTTSFASFSFLQLLLTQARENPSETTRPHSSATIPPFVCRRTKYLAVREKGLERRIRLRHRVLACCHAVREFVERPTEIVARGE